MPAHDPTPSREVDSRSSEPLDVVLAAGPSDDSSGEQRQRENASDTSEDSFEIEAEDRRVKSPSVGEIERRSKASGIEDVEFSEIRKLYGLPISEMEELLSWQQQVQARTFKIVRHLRAAEDKIAFVKREKAAALRELTEARAERDSFQSAHRETQEFLEALESERTSSDCRARELETQLATLQTELANLVTERSSIQSKLELAMNELSQQADALTIVRSENEESKQALIAKNVREETLQLQFAEAQKTIDALRSQIQASTNEREELIKLIRAAMVRLERREPKTNETKPTQ